MGLAQSKSSFQINFRVTCKGGLKFVIEMLQGDLIAENTSQPLGGRKYIGRQEVSVSSAKNEDCIVLTIRLIRTVLIHTSNFQY